jgi:hypothetical protein
MRGITAGIENVIREAELEEWKKWREENERILAHYPRCNYPEPASIAPPGRPARPAAGSAGRADDDRPARKSGHDPRHRREQRRCSII